MRFSHGNVSPEFESFRLDPTSIEPVIGNGTIAPSVTEAELTGMEIAVDATASTFSDTMESGSLSRFRTGTIVSSAGFSQSGNNGLFEIDRISNNNNTAHMIPLEGQVLADEVSSAATFVSNDKRLKYRTFMVDTDVTITFNGDSSQAFVLPAYTYMFLTDKMVHFSFDTSCTVFWGE